MNDSCPTVNKETAPPLSFPNVLEVQPCGELPPAVNVTNEPPTESDAEPSSCVCGEAAECFLLRRAYGGLLAFVYLTLCCLTSRKRGILQPSDGQLFLALTLFHIFAI